MTTSVAIPTTSQPIDKMADFPLKADCSRAVFGPRSVSRPVAPPLGLRGGPVGAGALRRTGGRVSSTSTIEHAAAWPLLEEDAMTKRSEAKYKIDRRLGQNIWGRP
jgi:hypothetical protein